MIEQMESNAVVHEKENRFTCELCNKSFSHNWYLKAHLKNHETPYNCNNCNKSFADKQKLKVHVNGVHKKLKPHKCSVCEPIT